MTALCRLLGLNKEPKITMTKAFLEDLADAYNCEVTPWARKYFHVEEIKTIELDRKVIKVNGESIPWDIFTYHFLLR